MDCCASGQGAVWHFLRIRSWRRFGRSPFSRIFAGLCWEYMCNYAEKGRRADQKLEREELIKGSRLLERFFLFPSGCHEKSQRNFQIPYLCHSNLVNF